MKALLLSAAMLVAPALGCAAMAQEFTPPPFDALQQQQRALEQQRLDASEKTRIAEQQRYLTETAKPGASPATQALRDLELQKEHDQIRLQGDLERMAATNERLATTAQLPNRRIARSSVLVVSNPSAYALPTAPAGKYYARIDGRFVLVDAMSELAETFVDAPAEPRGDKPLEPAPKPLPPAPVGP